MTQLERLQTEGIRRKGSKKSGFSYAHASGKRVSDEDLRRIRKLGLPPAWTDVFVSPSSTAKLQAVGKDAAGRWQYRYHASFKRAQEQKKYERLVHFADALPKLRRRVDADIKLPGMPRDKVLACVLRILSTCFIRAGSQVYAAENGSYGLATLRRSHVKVKGSTVSFDFPGKSKKRQYRELTDPTVAKLVKQLLPVGGPEVFKWKDDVTGEYVDVRRRHINEYIKAAMGEQFTAKDFRTWAGTLICACALARAGANVDAGVREKKRKVVEAVKATAEVLGNTPAICKSSYIWPTVLTAYDRGQVVESYFETVEELVAHQRFALHSSEKALLTLLKSSAAHDARGADPVLMMKKELHRRRKAMRRSAPHKRAA